MAAVFRRHRDADAGTDSSRNPLAQRISGGNGGDEPLASFDRTLVVCCDRQHHEFIAADTGRDVARGQFGFEAIRHRFE